MTTSQFKNCRIFTGETMLYDHVLEIDGHRVSGVTPAHEAEPLDTAIDLQGNIIAPGLIDLQVNGGGGALFNDEPSLPTIREIVSAHARCGTSAMLPTLISDSREKMHAAIGAASEAVAALPRSTLGIHLEGPFLSRNRPGVHDPQHFCQLDEEAFELIASASAQCRTLVTLAPETTTLDWVERLVAAGVVVSAGHTAASYDEMRAALDAGVTGFTHLFNAMTGLNSRDPGVVGAALADPHSWCGVIADGIHVHWATLEVALAAKPRGKVFLVSDAMPPVGSSQTSFTLNGNRITCSDGQCRSADGKLAGSAIDLLTAARNVVRYLDIEVEEALRMASLYPAEFLAVDGHFGRISAGYTANFIVVDSKLNLVATWVNGRRA